MVYFRSDIGRLGNQLFILAYALYLKRQYGISYVFSHVHFLKYFGFPFYRINNWIKAQFFFRILIKLKRYSNSNLICKVGYAPDIDSVFLNGNLKCIGYFQSPKYFEIQANYIKRKLQIKRRYRKEFIERYGATFTSGHVTVVHTRRTDYQEHKIAFLGDSSVILPIDYYKKAINQLSHKNTSYVLIGDDEDFLRTAFCFLDNKIIIHDKEIMDFQALLNADACILSNSTFAWWGAYLNVKKDRQIIGPMNFLGYNAGKEFPEHIYPKEWQLIG